MLSMNCSQTLECVCPPIISSLLFDACLKLSWMQMTPRPPPSNEPNVSVYRSVWLSSCSFGLWFMGGQSLRTFLNES